MEEERAAFIGDKLGFKPYGDCFRSDDGWIISRDYYIKWLSLPEGLQVIKQKMIERGYYWELSYLEEFSDVPNQYYMIFDLGCKSWSAWHETESEAMLAACYKALKESI